MRVTYDGTAVCCVVNGPHCKHYIRLTSPCSALELLGPDSERRSGWDASMACRVWTPMGMHVQTQNEGPGCSTPRVEQKAAEGAKLRMRGRGCLLDESWELADAFRALAVRKTCPSPRAWHGTEDARESCARPGERWEAAVNRLWAWTVPTFMTPVVPLALVGHTSAPSLVWDTRHGIAIDAVRRLLSAWRAGGHSSPGASARYAEFEGAIVVIVHARRRQSHCLFVTAACRFAAGGYPLSLDGRRSRRMRI